MACNSCKKTKEEIKETTPQKRSIWYDLKEYSYRTFVFIVLVIVLTPLIIPMLWVVLFKNVFLNQGLDLTRFFVAVGKKLQKLEEDKEEYEDFDDNEEYELYNPHDIHEIKDER